MAKPKPKSTPKSTPKITRVKPARVEPDAPGRPLVPPRGEMEMFPLNPIDGSWPKDLQQLVDLTRYQQRGANPTRYGDESTHAWSRRMGLACAGPRKPITENWLHTTTGAQ